MDGDIDFSRYSLEELREAERSIDRVSYPRNFENLSKAISFALRQASNADSIERAPKIDVSSQGHMRPEISLITFRARCPMCGWRLPILHKESRLTRREFSCPDCHSQIRLTRFWRMLNPLLMPLLIPFLAWTSFSDAGRGSRPWLMILLIGLALLNYWFERLEVVDDHD